MTADHLEAFIRMCSWIIYLLLSLLLMGMLIAEFTICFKSDQARIFSFIFLLLIPAMFLMCLSFCCFDTLLLQLSELVNVESYRDWIRLVAEFTLRSLQSWQVISLITGCKNSFLPPNLTLFL